MHINQIYFNGSKIKVRYSHEQGEYTFESEEQALPEFYEAFSALIGVFAEIAEINRQLKITVKSVDVDTVNEDLISVQLEGCVSLADTPGVLNISTPRKKVPAQAESELGNVRNKALSAGSVNKVMRVIEEAAKFVDGERAQQNLFDKKEKDGLKGKQKKLEVPKKKELPAKAHLTDTSKNNALPISGA